MAVDNNTVLRVATRWRQSQASDVVNVFDFIVAETVFSGDPADVITGVEIALQTIYVDTSLSPFMADNCVHADTSIYDVTHGAPIGYTGPLSLLDGENLDAQLPHGVAALIIFRTAVSRKVGKKYFGGLCAPLLTDGLWSSGMKTVLNDVADVLMAPIATGLDFTLQYTILTAGSLPANFPASFAVRDVPAYQRRRKQGVGS